MALHWRPVGPESAQTYWQRRAVVAAAALGVLLLLLSLLRGGDGERLAQQPGAAPTAGSATPTASPLSGPSLSGAPTASPSASGSPTPSAAAASCPDDVLEVEAAAEQDAYRVGSSPRLQLRVTNTGTTACTRDLGRSAVELVVVSGDDRIWSSDDCSPGGGTDVTTLRPGTPETSRVTWPGTRSLPGCKGSKARAAAGTYRLTARVGALRAQGEPFLLR